MPSLISCPGCNHTLTLPEDVVGQRARCPKCGLDFDAHPMATPALDLETGAPADNSSKPPDAAAQTGYTAGDVNARRTVAAGSVYCIMCGTGVAPADDACPGCGYRIHDLLEEAPRAYRRPVRRILTPVRGFLPVVGAILIPLGFVILVCGPIISEGFRRPRSTGFVIGVVCLVLAALIELGALACFMTWLYQAWRAVQRDDDEEYSPGLMVGLLFVPFFNFYWMFRAIPGLSAALSQELRYVAPRRTFATGGAPGLTACIIALIPPLWPIAICLFVAWALIVSNAVNRLVRLHDALPPERSREHWPEPEDT